MTQEKQVPAAKKPYGTPKLTVHGDVEAITLGDDLGEDVDAAFTTGVNVRGSKKPKKNEAFS